jgi:hypothetical protein
MSEKLVRSFGSKIDNNELRENLDNPLAHAKREFDIYCNSPVPDNDKFKLKASRRFIDRWNIIFKKAIKVGLPTLLAEITPNDPDEDENDQNE